MIKISVIIPVYNMEKYLSECLDSVFGQTLQDIEVICIDDGSTDNTGRILDEYNNLHDNMQVIWQKRQGAGSARNKGIMSAQGEFVAFMDSDDYYPTSSVLQKLYDSAKRHNVKIAGGGALIESEGKIKEYDKNRYSGQIFEISREFLYKEYQYPYGYGRFIYDRKLLLENDIMFPPYIRYQDPIFMVKAFDKAERIWGSKDATYVVRIFDKKLNFSSMRVMNDIARGLLDILEIANLKNYTILQSIVLEVLQSWKTKFWIHIAKGNHRLEEILLKSEEIMNGGNRSKNGDSFIADRDEIEKYIAELEKENETYYEKIVQHNKIIIYGAGEVGKSVYDFIQDIAEIEFLGFVVTDKSPQGMARGISIRCIDEFVEYRKEALLIIANMSIQNTEMEKRGMELGFEHILKINQEIVDVKQFKLESEGFAVL